MLNAQCVVNTISINLLYLQIIISHHFPGYSEQDWGDGSVCHLG